MAVIADNPLLLAELKKVFETELVESLGELGFSNERLGERVRARMEGKQMIEDAFRKIMMYQTPLAKGNNVNPAR